jgi:hypothetical protein
VRGLAGGGGGGRVCVLCDMLWRDKVCWSSQTWPSSSHKPDVSTVIASTIHRRATKGGRVGRCESRGCGMVWWGCYGMEMFQQLKLRCPADARERPSAATSRTL